MCLLWSTNWVFISQKTPFFLLCVPSHLSYFFHNYILSSFWYFLSLHIVLFLLLFNSNFLPLFLCSKSSFFMNNLFHVLINFSFVCFLTSQIISHFLSPFLLIRCCLPLFLCLLPPTPLFLLFLSHCSLSHSISLLAQNLPRNLISVEPKFTNSVSPR
jgi:hypothetical protein